VEKFEPEALAGLPSGYTQRRLPVGRHGLTRSQVIRNQRMRLVGAMLRVLPRHGYSDATITRVVKEAGVSRKAFYEQFENKEECFLETYELAGSWFCERVERAAGGEGEWPVRVRAGLTEALGLLMANPALSHLFSLDVSQAGRAARACQEACLGRLATMLRAGREQSEALPEELEAMLLGGALTTVARYVDTGRAKRLPDATGQLLQYLLIPYLGAAEAARYTF